MDRHLVTIEVGVEGRTYERVKLDGLTLDEGRLEGLDTESVQGRGTVQHNRVTLDDILEDVPNLRIQTVNHLLRILNVVGLTGLYQLLHHERLEQLEGHLLRNTALIDLQLRSYDDNRTSGVVYSLTEEVLTETSLLTL